MLSELRWAIGHRRVHRWLPGAQERLDLRRTLQSGVRHGGVFVELAWLHPKRKMRPLVLICDISGSMEPYTRMLLHFIHSLAAKYHRVGVFLFATQLTRVTRQFAHRGVDHAVAEVSRAIPDRAGGTRIGEVLRTFNVQWSRRVPCSSAVVLVISDGLDRGDPAVLREETARLQRTCHRLAWLNPLLGRSGYEPVTRGMQAALPFVDNFLPVHNLASLKQLTKSSAVAPVGQLAANPTYRHPLWGKPAAS